MVYEARTWKNVSADGSLPDGAIPLDAKNLNIMEEGIASCSRDIEFLSKLMEPETIWENDYPEVEFEAQKFPAQEDSVTIDLSNYKRFSVLFEDKIGSSRYVEYQVSQKDIDMYFGVNSTYSTNYEFGRIIKITNDQIIFSDSTRNGTKYTSYNNLSIPIKIIGYKY